MAPVVQSPLLLVEDLHFRYPGMTEAPGTQVHCGLTLAVPAAEVSVLFGAADAGKTTLARIVAGLVPRFTGGALEGRVLLGGIDIRSSRPFELIEEIGLVAQDSDEQIFMTRCDAEVAFALESLGMPRKLMIERVEESLSRVGLLSFRHRNPATLSGGEKKRLLMACLFAISPRLWILDESLQELDQSWKGNLLDAVRRTGATVLVLDSRWSSLVAQRAATFSLLSEGRIASSALLAGDPAFQGSLGRAGILPRAQAGAREERRGEAFLRAEGVSFEFPDAGGFSLKVDSLELRTGEICALLGSNGSGKSTLGRILCGLLAPRAGSLALRSGSSLRPASAEELSGRVGYLFQNPDHQIYLPTVQEELALGLRRQGVSRPEIEGRVKEAIELFSLPGPRAARPDELWSAAKTAGGDVLPSVARAARPRRGRLRFSCREVELLLDALLRRAPGILLITHDLLLAKAVSDRMLFMERGRITGDFRAEAFSRLDARAGGAAS